MQWYYAIAWFLIASQIFVLWFFSKNLKFSLSKPWQEFRGYTPKVLLTIPCKGLDLTFDENISSFFRQDYPGYVIHFVVESEQDPAYERLLSVKQRFESEMRADRVEVLVAGLTESCSQKIHNLLFSYRNCPEGVEALVFADSDACVGDKWLRDIVMPLKRDKTGVSTGYRWFVPQKNNIATIIMSVANAKVAQFLGRYSFNQAWGGSMAIRRDYFEQFEVDRVWSNVVSDDLAVSYLVRKAGKKVAFVPSCLVASYENTTIAKLYEFSRRQFIITRVYTPLIWIFGLLSNIYSVAGFFGSVLVGVLAILWDSPHLVLYTAVPVIFILCHWIKSFYRAVLVFKFLPEEVKNLRWAILADFAFGPIYSLLLLVSIVSSCYGREIVWRGVRYRLVGPEKTEIVSKR